MQRMTQLSQFVGRSVVSAVISQTEKKNTHAENQLAILCLVSQCLVSGWIHELHCNKTVTHVVCTGLQIVSCLMMGQSEPKLAGEGTV